MFFKTFKELLCRTTLGTNIHVQYSIFEFAYNFEEATAREICWSRYCFISYGQYIYTNASKKAYL
jgi:hypothetical protein